MGLAQRRHTPTAAVGIAYANDVLRICQWLLAIGVATLSCSEERLTMQANLYCACITGLICEVMHTMTLS
jgi:hypothetical protein